MPKNPIENNRLSLRIANTDKSVVMQAAALENTSITDFVLKAALEAAKLKIAEHQKIELSKQDMEILLDLLDNPPAPNKKLLKAAFNMPKDKD